MPLYICGAMVVYQLQRMMRQVDGFPTGILAFAGE